MSERRWIRDEKLDTAAVEPAVRDFLEQARRAGPFDWRADIQAATDDPEGCELVVNLEGPDSDLLLEYQGELLQALEYLAVRWLRLEPPDFDRIRFDSAGHRAGRLAELRLAARTAAEKAKQTRVPFRFAPMSARERRVLHLALREFPGVRTASEGEGPERALVIHPA